MAHAGAAGPRARDRPVGSVGTVGSWLLAGFSLASVIVVTSEAHAFREPASPR
jgi:hypothetical protein